MINKIYKSCIHKQIFIIVKFIVGLITKGLNKALERTNSNLILITFLCNIAYALKQKDGRKAFINAGDYDTRLLSRRS